MGCVVGASPYALVQWIAVIVVLHSLAETG